MISVRIVDVEYYMCSPIRDLDVIYSEFRGAEVRQVPVIQIYGPSQIGHKTCVNVHGVFPYVYIPYDGAEPAGNLSYKIAAELDKALNISLGQASSNTHHVHNIVLVSGIPLYGYHEKQHQFFKVYFYNPAIIKKACSLLENGAVLGKCFQPHESHINYILQFMMDYNLHGMSFVNISRAMYRVDLENPDLLDDIPPNLILPRDIQRRSISQFEIDAQASSITNRDEISIGKLAVNPGIAALWEDEKQRRRDQNKDSQISFCLTQDRNKVEPTLTHVYFANKLAEKLSREFSSDENSSTLNNSVYPAETPEDNNLNASTVDHTILDTTILDETIRESQNEPLSENDAKLLEVLQDLKESARVEEDSILSQQLKPDESVSSDEDEHNLSLSQKNIPDDDSVWENSFWDENCELPTQIHQLDGVYDTDTNDSSQSEVYLDEELQIYRNELDFSKTWEVTSKIKYRRANEVYINNYSNIPMDNKLNPGMNNLILSSRNSKPTCTIEIISDICVKSPNDSIKPEKRKSDDYDPLFILDNNCNYKLQTGDFEDDFVNKVIINDVNLGNASPASPQSLDETELSDSFVNSTPSKKYIPPFYLEGLLEDEMEKSLDNLSNKEITLVKQKRGRKNYNDSENKGNVSVRLTRSSSRKLASNSDSNMNNPTESTLENIEQKTTIVENSKKRNRETSENNNKLDVTPKNSQQEEVDIENSRKVNRKPSDNNNKIDITSENSQKKEIVLKNSRQRNIQTSGNNKDKIEATSENTQEDKSIVKKNSKNNKHSSDSDNEDVIPDNINPEETVEELAKTQYHLRSNENVISEKEKQCRLCSGCSETFLRPSAKKKSPKVKVDMNEAQLKIGFCEEMIEWTYGYNLYSSSKQFTSDCSLFSPERDKIFESEILEEFLYFPQKESEKNNSENCAINIAQQQNQENKNVESFKVSDLNILVEFANNGELNISQENEENNKVQGLIANTTGLPDLNNSEVESINNINLSEINTSQDEYFITTASSLPEFVFSEDEKQENVTIITENCTSLPDLNIVLDELNVENCTANIKSLPACLTELHISKKKNEENLVSAMSQLKFLPEKANNGKNSTTDSTELSTSKEEMQKTVTTDVSTFTELDSSQAEIIKEENSKNNTTILSDLNISQEEMQENITTDVSTLFETPSELNTSQKEKHLDNNKENVSTNITNLSIYAAHTTNILQEKYKSQVISISNKSDEENLYLVKNEDQKKISSTSDKKSKSYEKMKCFIKEKLKPKTKIRFIDGQADSTTSDSTSTSSQDEESSKIIEETALLPKLVAKKKVCTKLSDKMKCRVSGLSKSKAKKVKKKKNEQLKEDSSKNIKLEKLNKNLPQIKVLRRRFTENKDKTAQEKESTLLENKNRNGNDKAIKTKKKSLLKLKTNSISEPEQSEKHILSKENSVSTEIKLKDLQIVLVPLDLSTLNINNNLVPKNTKNVEANTDVIKSMSKSDITSDSDKKEQLKNSNGKMLRETSAKHKLSTRNSTAYSSSTSSSEIEQLDKKIKTEYMNNQEPHSYLLKSFESPINHRTSVSSSSDDANDFENKTMKKRLRLRKHVTKSVTSIQKTFDVDKSHFKMSICPSSSDEKTKKDEIIQRKTKRGRRYKLAIKRTGHNSLIKQIIPEKSEELNKNTQFTSNFDKIGSSLYSDDIRDDEKIRRRVTRSSSNNSSNSSKSCPVERSRKRNLKDEVVEKNNTPLIPNLLNISSLNSNNIEEKEKISSRVTRNSSSLSSSNNSSNGSKSDPIQHRRKRNVKSEVEENNTPLTTNLLNISSPNSNNIEEKEKISPRVTRNSSSLSSSNNSSNGSKSDPIQHRQKRNVKSEVLEENNTPLITNLLNISSPNSNNIEEKEKISPRVTRNSSSLSSSNNSSNGSKSDPIQHRRKRNIKSVVVEENNTPLNTNLLNISSPHTNNIEEKEKISPRVTRNSSSLIKSDPIQHRRKNDSSDTTSKPSVQEQNSEVFLLTEDNLKYPLEQNITKDNAVKIEINLIPQNKVTPSQKIKNEAQELISKNVEVRLERLSPELLKRQSVITENLINNSPEKLPVRNGARNANKIKKTNSPYLLKSPRRATNKNSNALSPRYNPLNIITRSPKKQANLVQAMDNNDYEPMTKRLRSNVEAIDPIIKNEVEKDIILGIGESSHIPVLQKEDETSDENVKIINRTVTKDCDITDKFHNNVSTPHSIRKRLFNSEDKLDVTVYEEFKTCSYENSLMSTPTVSTVDDINRDISYLTHVRQEEEKFLQQIDSHYSTKKCDTQNLTSHKNQTEQEEKNSSTALTTISKRLIKFPEIEITPVKECNKNPVIKVKTNLIQENKCSKLNNKNNGTKPKSVKKKDKKPVSPIKSKNVDYLYITPEKDSHFFSPRETLSQQGERELCNISEYNTKIHNLTIAEMYDLKRDFAPQPSTSKFCDEVPVSQTSSNTSFTYYDISLIDKSSMLNNTQCSTYSSGMNTTNINNSNIWMPKYYPPSRSDIKNTLSDYNIPEHRYQQPFYSDHSDVTGKVDIGHNVLKIPSATTADLEEFESSNGFVGVEKWRKDKFKYLYPTEEPCKNLRVTLAGHSKFVMTPVNPPPSKKEIVLWLQSKINESQEKTVQKIEKPRIIIPLSPGNSNDSFNDSMTLSPCTPEIKSPVLSQNIVESSQTTPVTSQDSQSIVRNCKKRGNLQRKALFSQSKHLKLNLTENQSSNDSCQITGVTLDNTHGFQMSFENLQNAKAISEHQYLTILVVELHIRTRGEMYPDPQYDSVRAIFYSILNDVPEDFSLPREETGVIVVDTLPGSPVKDKHVPILEGTGVKCKINYVKSEIELIDEFVKLIRKWDPDIFVGFEIEMLSWGYLIERCSVIGINLPDQISRINPAVIKRKSNEKQSEQELKLAGRIILDAWRLFRHETALQSYTFENLMYHILHRRVPAHSFKNLSFWWEYRSNYFRHITANYYITRVEGILKLLDQLDIIGRTSELARLFGIQFYEVLSRGTQFRVESMMLRLAKPLNYIPVSPSVQQRAKMRAPEWVPLILEPESRFYTDPLIVLDFQSLYPSIIIAYNYCFSTCIGRVEQLGSNIPFDFGACQLKIKRSGVQKLKDKINFSPCGAGFVKPEVREGILPRMLKEILETRLMVKKSMKESKENKVLQRVLHSRQLGLKLIANVTYGYTSANFSGRMPCIEVADSVVSKGRETLERAINMIEKNDSWHARVVYGDTDSLFVSVPGRSREDAFKIGTEIAEAVTNDNPPPVKLKLEKVYHPSLLQTKKRYVGYMYESPEQKEPQYDAKGIETVRRDGCPAVAKILEKSLRFLFETRDISLIKRYVCRQFEKLLTGRASIQNLIFAREFRGLSGYRPGACVPALELARRWTATDKRREPRRGERVPYIVVHGPPGAPLIRLVRCPRELLNQEQNSSLRPNAVYYITKVIAPPLNRCLSLIGADVQVWFKEMPRKQLQTLPTDIHFEKSKKSTISQYFSTMSCVVCSNQTRDGLCEACCNNPQQTIVVIQEKLRKWETSFEDVKQICQSCCGRVEYTDCASLDCPVLYRLNQTKRDLKQVPFLRNLLKNFDSEN